MPQALDGLTVLDLSHALAGPFATTMLADFGATVIKLEAPGGDMSRGWGPPFVGGESAYFLHLNRNKQSIAVDLRREEGRDIFFRLLDRADVVVENFRVGTVDRLGIGYEPCRARNPRVVFASISGFGQDGPYRDRAALDLVVQAESGMMSVTGETDGRGVRCGVSIADLTAGMIAAFAILAALQARTTTGRGQFIDVSMLEGQLALLAGQVGSYLTDGAVPKPMGTAYKQLLPYQTFRTATRDIAIGVGSDRLWQTFCPVVGLPELADDPRFRTNAARNAHRAELVSALQDAFLAHPYEEWEPLLTAAGVPVGAINTIADVVAHPQVAARGALAEVAHPTAGRMLMVGPAARLSETPGAVRTPAPRLGEHTDAVLDSLGIERTRIDALRRAQVIV